ncbi:MAG TPA: ABC transporter permease, partial [Bryobacteraceae bacterium]|nr:ABC transporter permease [Bryobacteraceae bacterium]
MDSLLKDIRYALRMLARSPGFSAVAILTLALGIGANTAIFSLVNAVLLKSLPIERPEELWLLGAARTYGVVTGQSGSYSVFSYPLYNYLRERSPFFQDLCAFQSQDTLIGVRRVGVPADATPPTMGKLVSGNYFSVLGVRAALGRTLLPEDDRPGAPPVAVMSYRYWSRNLGSSREALSSSIAINGVPVTIIGVAPPEFFGETLKSDPPDFWLPLAAERVLNPTRPLLDSRDSHWLFVMGRFQPTAATEDARTQARTRLTHDLKQWLAEEGGANPDAETRRRVDRSYIEFTPGGSGIQHLRRRYSDSLRILIAITGLVLAIACANLANLLLARGTARTREISVRLALGAARARLMRQSLTESLVLAIAGGVAGLALAAFAQRALLAMVFRDSGYVPIAAEPDRTLLAFSFAVSIVTGLVFGIAPAWSMARQDVAGSLRGVGAAGKAGAPRRGLLGLDFKKLLVAGQIAMSLVLLFGAGLLGRSLMNLDQQQLGFQRDRVMLFKVDPQFSGYRANQLDQLYDQITDRIRAIPGVAEMSYSLYSPFGSRWSSGIAVAGFTPPPGKPANSMWDRVGPRYFATIGTRLVMGRLLDERDQPNSKRVAVVNETFARMFLAGGSPLGGH